MYFPRIEDLRIDSDKKQYEIAAYPVSYTHLTLPTN